MSLGQQRLLLGAMLPLRCSSVWQAWGMAQSNQRVPLPSRVLAAAVDLIVNGDLPAALLQSLGRVFAGFAIAALLAHTARTRDGMLSRGRAQPRSAGRELPADRRDRDPAARDPLARHRHAGGADDRRLCSVLPDHRQHDRRGQARESGAAERRGDDGLVAACHDSHGRRAQRAARRSSSDFASGSAWRGPRSSRPSSRWAPRRAAAARAASAR